MDLSIDQSASPDTHYSRFSRFVLKHRHTYLFLAILYAFTGYAFVMLLPVLIFTAATGIYQNLTGGPIVYWLPAVIWLGVMGLAALLSYRCFQVKPAAPAGLTLTEDRAAEIYKLIEKIQSHFKRPKIHRIIITGNYELDIVKVPRTALPLCSMNIMVIGLPVLLCHSPKQFECMVTRRLGQFSKQRNPVLNWLYQLRASWSLYADAYYRQKYPESKLLAWFYSAYAHAYSAMTVFVARREELTADTCATEIYNDADVRQMITADSVYRWQLQHNFWPAVEKIATVNTGKTLKPYSKLATSIHNCLTPEKLTTLLEEIINTETDEHEAFPSLRNRLDNIGHDKPSMSIEKAAGQSYLGSSLENVIDLFDKLWLKNHTSK